MLKLKIFSAIKFIRSKKINRVVTESIYNQLMKKNASNLEISIDKVLSKLIDYNLVSIKKTSAGLDSFSSADRRTR